MRGVFPLCYFPPISFFIYMQDCEEIDLDIYENFVKQTYRNRCEILGANGVLNLIVPIHHQGKRVMKDIKISEAESWQKTHWKSLQSAYQRSPYFEFYEDVFHPFFEKTFTYLVDLNQESIDLCLQLLKWNPTIKTTDHYEKEIDGKDFRNDFNPKEKINLGLERYNQVFEDRFPFQENLSIFDLICNKGPESHTYLKQNLIQLRK